MSAALKRILCIDDEQDILEVASMALETVGGFTVKTCRSGKDGAAAVDGFQPDLVLLDVMMPGLDGPATLKLLQANPNAKRLPIVFMTAKVQPSETAQYLTLGAAGVIAKPFDPMTLPQEVSTLYGKFHGK